MPEHCEDHTKLVEDVGELRGTLLSSLSSQGKRIESIESMVKDIYEKVNSGNVNNAYFKGRVSGGVAVLITLSGLVSAAVAYFIKHFGGT